MPEITISTEGLQLLPITSIYIALNALVMLGLAFMVVRARQANAKSGGKLDAPRDNAVRAHGNNIEYVPIALLILIAMEFSGAPGWSLHGLGIMLTLSRIAHGYGRGSSDGANPGRLFGTLGTWIMILVSALALLYLQIS